MKRRIVALAAVLIVGSVPFPASASSAWAARCRLRLSRRTNPAADTVAVLPTTSHNSDHKDQPVHKKHSHNKSKSHG